MLRLAFGFALVASGAHADQIVGATYRDPTTRYPHGVLGDEVEFGAMEVRFGSGRVQSYSLPETLVYEDLAPRLIDVNGDGQPEVLTTESHQNFGARFTIYAAVGRDLQPIFSTPYIGQRFRWLGLIGAADLDGDGTIEIAYIDRPHLAKTLRVWRVTWDGFGPATGQELATKAGLTNHRIGEDFVSSGIKSCDEQNSLITVDASWENWVETRFDGRALSSQIIAPFESADDLGSRLSC